MKSKQSITAVLNLFKRPQNLHRQIAAVLTQSAKPHDLMIWQNDGCELPSNIDLTGTAFARCNRNLGVWSRFAFALNAKTEFVCILDDDTIPGSNWFKNCLATMDAVNGLIGTCGVKFCQSSSYMPIQRTGWPTPSNEIKQCDIVGHSWFFRREWLSYFWSEMPEITQSTITGEDMHFSYMLQKSKIDTFTAPHPIHDRSYWGSLDGKALGTERNGISMTKEGMREIQNTLPLYVNKGFRLLCERQGQMT